MAEHTSNVAWQRQPRLVDNYSQVPHGLWTAPVSPGARCLLGWLHSHTPQYLASLSFNRIRNEFSGSGQVAVWIKELVDEGLVRQVKVGQSYRYVLLAAKWEQLARRDRPEIGQEDQVSGNRTPTVRIPDSNRPEIGHIEDHVEDQLEDQLMPTVPVGEKTASSDFDVFWSGYPRKVGKTKALRVWGRLSKGDRLAALKALPEHVSLWRVRQVAAEFIPHPTSWLNGRRWEDELLPAQTVVSAFAASRSAPGMGLIKHIIQSNKQGEIGD